MPSRLNCPTRRLSAASSSSPWKIRIVTAGWLSETVVKYSPAKMKLAVQSLSLAVGQAGTTAGTYGTPKDDTWHKQVNDLKAGDLQVIKQAVKKFEKERRRVGQRILGPFFRRDPAEFTPFFASPLTESLNLGDLFH